MNWPRPLKARKKKPAGGVVGAKLDWKVLKDGKCPACFGELEDKPDQQLLLCARKGCNFAISHKKFQEITSREASSSGVLKGHSRGPSEEEQNLSELNNLKL